MQKKVVGMHHKGRAPIASIWRTRFVTAGGMAIRRSYTAVTAVKPSVKRNTRGSSPKKGREHQHYLDDRLRVEKHQHGQVFRR